MRKLFLLFVMTAFSIATAQTQQGFVKTKGRLGSNGKVIKGARLPGTMVTVKGRNAVVSGKNGSFTLVIPGRNYYLKNVQKEGYVITDPDILSREYSYSKDSLILVLESQEQQNDDKLQVERKIRRNLQHRLQQREEEIETLKEENKITKLEYQNQLKKLYAEQKSNEKLISDMSERYSQIDYDQVDEFNQRICKCILDGQLTEADSLLKTKGDIKTRTLELRHLQEQNAKDDVDLSKRKKKLEENKELANKKLEDIAQDCYSKFEIFKMQHKNDSAAYYIVYRSSLDTTNIDWKLCSTNFIKNTIADYDRAMTFAKEALNTARVIYGDSNLWVARAYNMIGCIFDDKTEYSNSIDYFNKSLSLKKHIYGNNHLEIADCLHNIGNVYSSMGKYEKALEYYTEALNIRENCPDSNGLDIAKSYNGLGGCYIEMGENYKALEYIEKALEIKKSIKGEKEIDVGISMHNMALVYSDLKKYEKSLHYDLNALSIFKEQLGENHPTTAACYISIGNTYKEIDSLKLAKELHLKALNIYRKYLGENIDVAKCYGNIANVYSKMGRFEESIEYNNRSLTILKENLGNKHPIVAMVYTNIGTTYLAAKKYNEALEYANMSLDIFKEVFGEKHPFTEKVIKNINEIENKMNSQTNK